MDYGYAGRHPASRKHVVGVRDNYRVIVDVHHPRIWTVSPRYLMNIVLCREAGPYVNNLPDSALTDKVAHHALEEVPVLAARVLRVRQQLQ
jgi:hypothetical protein